MKQITQEDIILGGVANSDDLFRQGHPNRKQELYLMTQEEFHTLQDKGLVTVIDRRPRLTKKGKKQNDKIERQCRRYNFLHNLFRKDKPPKKVAIPYPETPKDMGGE